MTPTITPQAFVAKWQQATLRDAHRPKSTLSTCAG